MSKICAAANSCPFSQQQTTAGCPCAELCPGFCESTETISSTSAVQIDYTQKDW